jgi:hypothetical protein
VGGSVWPDRVPDAVAFEAMNPCTSGPQPNAELGGERVCRDTWTLFLTPMASVGFVEAFGVELGDVPAVADEVHELLRARGRRQVAWSAPNGSALHEVLSGLGMTPYADPPLEDQYTALALVRPPRGADHPDVSVREATSDEDFEMSTDLAVRVFSFSDEDAEGLRRHMRARCALRRTDGAPTRNYVAFIDGELVGEAQSTFTDVGTALTGGGVLESARGRGVYRQLIAARWDAAVARGKPALTVQAGAMSAPRLVKLGFEQVAVMAVLRDRLD